jgi:hypothetical protein
MISIFWVVTPCSLVNVYRFKRNSCFCFRDRRKMGFVSWYFFIGVSLKVYASVYSGRFLLTFGWKYGLHLQESLNSGFYFVRSDVLTAVTITPLSSGVWSRVVWWIFISISEENTDPNLRIEWCMGFTLKIWCYHEWHCEDLPYFEIWRRGAW